MVKLREKSASATKSSGQTLKKGKRQTKKARLKRKVASQRSIKSREASSKLSSDSDKIFRSSRARRGGDITDSKIEVN